MNTESLTGLPCSRWGWWQQKLQHSLLWRNVALLVLWLLVFEIGWLVEYTHHASVWFPVAGLTFAALLLFGITLLPALLTGCVLITFYTARHYAIPLSDLAIVKAGLLFGLAHILPYAAGAALFRLLARRNGDVSRTIVLFLLIAAASSLVATALVLTALVLSQMMTRAEISSTWLPFWIGDMAGVLVMAPFFIGVLSLLIPSALFRLTDLGGLSTNDVKPQVLFKLLANVLFLTFCMVLAKVSGSANSAFAIFFMVIPHMWIACSESPLLNVTSVALSSFLIAFWVHVFDLKDFVMVYQFAISVIAANTLFGLAIPTLLADNSQLRKVAFTDSLTQVASRERLEQRASLDLIRAGYDDTPFTLMVFDIDHFKQINDEFGHHVGDQALQQMARLVQTHLRPADLLGRFGGDEFVVLLPDTALAAASQIAERIIAHVAQLQIGDSRSLSASFGVAQWQPGEGYTELFRRADRALYDAKLAGRSCVRLA